MHEVELVGLPGVKRVKKVRAGWARSVTGFMRAIGGRRAVTFAGDAGSVNVWIDDGAQYRCCFQQYMSIKDMQTFATKADVRRWLKTWLPRAVR